MTKTLPGHWFRDPWPRDECIDRDNPFPGDPDAPKGREQVKAYEVETAVISLRADFTFLLANGYRDEAVEFLTWAEESWADSVWGRK